MKQIAGKLRSNSGASMVIALVFMMFCLFVGGSVLAAATANGSRVEHLSDQQDYLDQRSAAMLIADELRANNANNQLIVHDVTQVVQKVVVGANGVATPTNDPPVTYRTITFQAPSTLKMSVLQRLMYETTVWRYLQQNSVSLSSANLTIEVKDFYDHNGNAINGLAGFWYSQEGTVSGSISITGPKENIAYNAEFISLGGESLFDFHVGFGEYTQLSVMMYAFTGTREPVIRESVTRWNNSYDALVQTTSQRYTISWDPPAVVKGGA